MSAISPSFDLLDADAKRRYVEAHLLDALKDLQLAHPAHKARCQERVDSLLHKLGEVICA